MTANQIQDKIIADFTVIGNWFDQYAYLIEIAKDLKEFNPQDKTDENLVQGCQSNVWLISSLKNGKIVYQADSNTLIIKGIVALLLEIFSDRTPEEILHTELYFFTKVGLKQHLSDSRSDGIYKVVQKIKQIAREALKENGLFNER